MSGHFLVRQARGPAWDPSRGRRQQHGWDEHAAFIDRLAEEGRVVLGGPVGEIDGQDAVLLLPRNRSSAHGRPGHSPLPSRPFAGATRRR